MQTLVNSPFQKVTFLNKQFYIKRDDLLDKDFSGNKARKFFYFFQQDLANIDNIVSYGSNQSNAMYSLSVLSKIKNKKFFYYTDHISTYLLNNLQGNLKYALQNGMQLVSKEQFDTLKNQKNTLYIKEGGAIQEAKYGMKQLANELQEHILQYNLKNPCIFLPSGTGTTALFLQYYLQDIKVATTYCVSNKQYLQQQFKDLIDDQKYHPTIIDPPRKYHFGKLYKENIAIWKKLLDEINIEFDLLYDPIGWNTLLKHYDNNIDYIYVHQGGAIGNESMLWRYIHKGYIDDIRK